MKLFPHYVELHKTRVELQRKQEEDNAKNRERNGGDGDQNVKGDERDAEKAGVWPSSHTIDRLVICIIIALIAFGISYIY